MIVLGIDTSCDDTSAGIVADGTKTLANVIHSQVAVHHPHGGVVPELASQGACAKYGARGGGSPEPCGDREWRPWTLSP